MKVADWICLNCKFAKFDNMGGFGAGFWIRGGDVVNCPANVEHYEVVKANPERFSLTPEQVTGNLSKILDATKAEGWVRVRWLPEERLMIDAPTPQSAKQAADWVVSRLRSWPRETNIWVNDHLTTYTGQDLEHFI